MMTIKHVSFKETKNGDNERSHLKNNAISLSHFKVLSLLGEGSMFNSLCDYNHTLDYIHLFELLGTGCVYLAKKISGSDDGKLYALKVLNLSIMLKRSVKYKKDILRNEREVFIAIRQ